MHITLRNPISISLEHTPKIAKTIQKAQATMKEKAPSLRSKMRKSVSDKLQAAADKVRGG